MLIRSSTLPSTTFSKEASRRLASSIAAVLILLLSWPVLGASPPNQAAAHDAPDAAQDVPQAHCHTPAPPAAEPVAGAALVDIEIPDTPLVDQSGREVHFATDLVDGKVVAMNFVFTTCTTICPPMGANFGQLQKLLGDRAGRDVHLVSVSIDPTIDTPERLAAWGQTFGAGPAWTLVTGDKPLVDGLLRKLGVFVGDKQYHSPIVLLGNAESGQWLRTNGLTPAPQLLEQIDRLTPSTSATSAEHDHGHSEAASE